MYKFTMIVAVALLTACETKEPDKTVTVDTIAAKDTLRHGNPDSTKM